MIVIVDYGMGNLGSIKNMLKKIGVPSIVTADHSAIASATKLILPGVGAFDNGMRNLDQRGLIPILDKKVREEKTPILGLCLGMQLFARKSAEGVLYGLGWIDAEVVRFSFTNGNAHLKIPHMGWNTIRVSQQLPVLNELHEGSRFYFVHSFHLASSDASLTLAETDYGYPFPSAIAKDNILGMQFHPEKSHKFGMTLLRNFATIN